MTCKGPGNPRPSARAIYLALQVDRLLISFLQTPEALLFGPAKPELKPAAAATCSEALRSRCETRFPPAVCPLADHRARKAAEPWNTERKKRVHSGRK